jgi:hypothetical protein
VHQIEDRISGLEDKVDVLEQSDEEKWKKKKRKMNGRYKNSETPLKDQTYE